MVLGGQFHHGTISGPCELRIPEIGVPIHGRLQNVPKYAMNYDPCFRDSYMKGP